jgi:hypothetical protein
MICLRFAPFGFQDRDQYPIRFSYSQQRRPALTLEPRGLGRHGIGLEQKSANESVKFDSRKIDWSASAGAHHFDAQSPIGRKTRTKVVSQHYLGQLCRTLSLVHSS